MRHAWMIGLPLMMALGACAVEPGSDGATVSSLRGSLPPGFEAWLAEQCPEGDVVGIIDRSDPAAATMKVDEGVLLRAASCEEVRARALDDPWVQRRLADVYQRTASQVGPSQLDERIGVAQDPWSPFGLACGIVAASLGLAFNWPFGGHAGCKDPHAANPGACEAVTGGGSVALGLLCALI
jgi:hypothetical protein